MLGLLFRGSAGGRFLGIDQMTPLLGAETAVAIVAKTIRIWFQIKMENGIANGKLFARHMPTMLAKSVRFVGFESEN